MTTAEARAIVEEFSSMPPNAGAAEVTRLKGALMNVIGHLTNHVDTLYADPDKAGGVIKAAKAAEEKRLADEKRAAEVKAAADERAARVVDPRGLVPPTNPAIDPQVDRDEAHRRAEFGTTARTDFGTNDPAINQGNLTPRQFGDDDVTGHEDADARVRAARKHK